MIVKQLAMLSALIQAYTLVNFQVGYFLLNLCSVSHEIMDVSVITCLFFSLTVQWQMTETFVFHLLLQTLPNQANGLVGLHFGGQFDHTQAFKY